MQEFGLALLVRQDNIARRKREDREVRLAMIASGRATPDEAFPEEFMPVIEGIDAANLDLNRDDVDYDYSAVEWQGPEGMDADEMADLEAFLNEPTVTVPTPPRDEWS